MVTDGSARAKNSEYVGEYLRCTDVSCMTASDYGTIRRETPEVLICATTFESRRVHQLTANNPQA